MIVSRDNNEYVALGNHGLAIIGSVDRNIYEMIGYKEKTHILFKVKVNNDFTFYNQNDNFSTFYDGESINWLVKFVQNDQEEFTKILESNHAKIVLVPETSPKNDEKTSENVINFPKPDLPEKPVLVNFAKDDLQSDSSGSKQRANILNRMAKMGQAILPRSEMKYTSTELSDSDIDEKTYEKRISPRQLKREKSSKQTILTNLNIESKTETDYNNQSLTNQISNAPVIPNQVLCNPQQLPNQLFNAQSMPHQIYYPNWSNDGYNQYMIAQNTELKVNLAQISSKLDLVLNSKNGSNDDDDKKNLLSRLKAMKLKTENLESSLQKSEEKYSVLTTKYVELERKLQNTSGVESKNKEIDILESSLSELQFKLQEVQQKSEERKCELVTYKNNILELKEIIATQRDQLREYEKLEKENKHLEELNDTIASQNKIVDILKLKQKDFEEYFEKAEAEKKVAAQKSNTKIKSLDEVVKKHMNEMYQSVLNNFEEDGTYKFSDIQMGVAKNLKITSFKIIEDCVNIFKENNVLEE